jgi:hypothetical protein
MPLPPVTSSMNEPSVREQEVDDPPPPPPPDIVLSSNNNNNVQAMMLIPPRPTQPSANLMNDLREYLAMNDFDQYAAGCLLTTLGCQERLPELAIMSPAEFRAELAAHYCGGSSTTPNPTPFARSKLLEACKILHNGGQLDELRSIGYNNNNNAQLYPRKKNDLVSFVVGDQRFTSSLATLCRVKDSYL